MVIPTAGQLPPQLIFIHYTLAPIWLLGGGYLTLTEERLQYMQISPDLGEWELGTYFTFTQHDIDVIQQRRRDYNRLGFAVQLCILRYLGWTLSDVKEVPENILRYIAKQIKVDAREFKIIRSKGSYEV
jgi:TnpA family transposase